MFVNLWHFAAWILTGGITVAIGRVLWVLAGDVYTAARLTLRARLRPTVEAPVDEPAAAFPLVAATRPTSADRVYSGHTAPTETSGS